MNNILGNWNIYMELPVTTGTIGSSQVQQITTVDVIMR